MSAYVFEESNVLDPSIPTSLQDRLSRELEPNEVVQWSGMPKAMFFTPAAIGTCLFSIPFTGFAIFWIAMASGLQMLMPFGGGPMVVFPLFGIPFVLVGIGMFLAPLWAYLRALHTVYAITDRRAISISGVMTVTVQTHSPASLTDLIRREYWDGTGDIIIERRVWRNSNGRRRTEEHGFFRIADPKEVESCLRNLAAHSSHDRSD